MSEEDIKKIYTEMLREFGTKLPNPIHEPRQFEFYVKLYLNFKFGKQ